MKPFTLGFLCFLFLTFSPLHWLWRRDVDAELSGAEDLRYQEAYDESDGLMAQFRPRSAEAEAAAAQAQAEAQAEAQAAEAEAEAEAEVAELAPTRAWSVGEQGRLGGGVSPMSRATWLGAGLGVGLGVGLGFR